MVLAGIDSPVLLFYTIPMNKNHDRIVWPSNQGDQRKKEQQPARVKSLPPQQQTAYLHRDSKGRGGKSVTLIKNLVLSEEDMKSLAKKIKQDCGVDGTVKDQVIEIQSEQRQKIAGILRKLRYKVKIAGG